MSVDDMRDALLIVAAGHIEPGWALPGMRGVIVFDCDGKVVGRFGFIETKESMLNAMSQALELARQSGFI